MKGLKCFPMTKARRKRLRSFVAAEAAAAVAARGLFVDGR